MLTDSTGASISSKHTKVPKPKALNDPNAPKRPRGRPRKDGAMPHARKEGATSSSASESDSDDLEVEEISEPKPAVLISGPPAEVEGRALYDVVQAVWSPRNKPAIPDRVRSGIAMFGDTVKKLRDAWKVKNESLKQAELANTTAIPSLKQEVARYRHLIETVVRKAIELGHESHLKKYVLHSRSPIHIFFTFLVWVSFHITPVRSVGRQRRYNNRHSMFLMHAIIKAHHLHPDSIKQWKAWRATAANGHINDIDHVWLACHRAPSRSGLRASSAAFAVHTCRPKHLLI